jgi:membrane protease YdiL (CAAX protease family)
MIRLILGVALAIAITTTFDATGLTNYSALPLIPLFMVFARLDRLTMRDLGLRLARPADYGLALAHPVVVMSALSALAFLAGAIDLSHFQLVKVVANVALLSAVTFVLAIITEEGFFRGWLWGAARKLGMSPIVTLVVTTTAFVAWHISFVALSGEFHFDASDVPVFFVNATLIGFVWGLLRLGSGSIIVSSAAHGLWNGLTYVLFGVGSGVGALGIRDVSLFGPEVGLIAVALNAAFLFFLLWLYRDRLGAGHAQDARAN